MTDWLIWAVGFLLDHSGGVVSGTVSGIIIGAFAVRKEKGVVRMKARIKCKRPSLRNEGPAKN